MKQSSELHYKLGTIARKIVENNKGILALDESPQSLDHRFSLHKIENTIENRRKYRQIVLGANFNNMVGGVILHEETFEQMTDSGKLFVEVLKEQGVAPGIKLDKGLIDYRLTEKVSVGLEDLNKRLMRDCYRNAEFAKWRSVFRITETTPTAECINENCSVLSKYAFICQKHGIVPIVEPELLWDGLYTIEESELITKTIIGCLFYHMNLHSVYIPGVLLKMGFVTPGKISSPEIDLSEVARRTFQAVISSVPAAVPGVVFLSGGHSPEDSTLFLGAVNREKGLRICKLSFSYGRALTDPILAVWGGEDKNIMDAIAAFEKRLKETHEAVKGGYNDK